MATSSSWYSKFESRWAARGVTPAAGGSGEGGLELRRLPTEAERIIPAPRAAVWAVIYDDDEDHRGLHQQIAGAPASGLGARQVTVGPPLPPFGLRSVMYCEVTAELEGHWFTCETWGGGWQLTETFMLQDAGDGQTLARITGWWMKPALRTEDVTKLHADLNGLAADALDRLAVRALGGARSDSTPEPEA